MKMLISLLVASALVTACSSGGGGGSAGPSAPGANFKPNEKPANAASMQDVEAMFAQLRKSEELLPENNAIFKAVLAGAEKQIVSAQDKEIAIRKLNPQGATFLANILTSCTISDAQSFGGNEPPQVNVPVRKNGYLSTRGTKCPYIVNEQVQQDTTYTSASNTSVVGVVKQVSVVTKDILDNQVVMASGLIAFNQTMDMTNNFTVTQSNNTSTMNALVSGTGTIEIKMVDATGEGKLSGPVTVQGTFVNGVMDMHMLFEGVSKKGVVRVVVQMNTNTGFKVFVNGEEVSPEKIGGLPKAFTSSIEQ